MSHRLLAVTLASLALIAGGCGSEEPESPEAATPSPSPTSADPGAVPTQPLATKPNEPAKAPKKAPSASAGLIGSTDPDERAQQVQSRINAERGTQTVAQGDPFGQLYVPPARVKLPEPQSGAAGSPGGNGTAGSPGGNGTAGSPGGNGTAGSPGGGGTAGTPGGGGTAGTPGGGGTAGTPGGGGTAGTPGGGGTAGTRGSSKTVSLPPLPAVTAQVAEPVSDIPTLFAPPTILVSTSSTISASTGGGGGSTSSPSGGGGGVASAPSRGGGGVASAPSRGGGGVASAPSRAGGGSTSSPSGGGGGAPSSPSRGGGGSTASPSGGGGGSPSLPSEEIPPVASLPPLPELPPAIGPALPPEEPVAALPPLDSGSVGQLPPLPAEIGPAIPPPPVEPPAVSETVTITGVVQVGNEIQVIVQLPGSSTGRYVKVGDVIANGQVRIKRVEGIQSSNPIVILEEEGVEYARAVGDMPTIAMEESDRV